jgi:hypothetical protein
VEFSGPRNISPHTGWNGHALRTGFVIPGPRTAGLLKACALLYLEGETRSFGSGCDQGRGRDCIFVWATAVALRRENGASDTIEWSFKDPNEKAIWTKFTCNFLQSKRHLENSDADDARLRVPCR